MAQIEWNSAGGFEVECGCDQCKTGHRCDEYYQKHREGMDQLAEDEKAKREDMDTVS
jgi:hypothetical protein